MEDLYRHRKRKKRLMKLSFIFFQICRNRSHLGLAMGRRIGPMEHMVVGILVVIGHMGMT